MKKSLTPVLLASAIGACAEPAYELLLQHNYDVRIVQPPLSPQPRIQSLTFVKEDIEEPEANNIYIRATCFGSDGYGQDCGTVNVLTFPKSWAGNGLPVFHFLPWYNGQKMADIERLVLAFGFGSKFDQKGLPPPLEILLTPELREAYVQDQRFYHVSDRNEDLLRNPWAGF